MATSKSPFTPFLPVVSLLRSSKLLGESSASLLQLAFRLPKLCGKGSPKPCSSKPSQSCRVPPLSLAKAMWSLLAWLLGLGFDPSASLPLQPHSQLFPQSARPASIPVFFQLFWAAIVSLGRCGPVAWSQSSSSSHAGAITRGICLPVTFWVEVTSIPLAQSMATAI